MGKYGGALQDDLEKAASRGIPQPTLLLHGRAPAHGYHENKYDIDTIYTTRSGWAKRRGARRRGAPPGQRGGSGPDSKMTHTKAIRMGLRDKKSSGPRAEERRGAGEGARTK